MHTGEWVPKGARRRFWVLWSYSNPSYRRLWAARHVLGIEPWCSAGVVTRLTC